MSRPILKLPEKPARAQTERAPAKPTAKRVPYGAAQPAAPAKRRSAEGAHAARPPVVPRERAPLPVAVAPRAPRVERAERPVGAENALPRLSKRLAELGFCSRREADEWIENGWVKVDGIVVDVLGSRVAPDAKIEVDREAQRHQAKSVTILLNKPIGYVSGQAEDGHPPAAILITPDNRWIEDNSSQRWLPAHARRLAPAGRLDIDSTGLLVLTQDGRVARHLIGEDSTIEKEYLVRVVGELSPDGLRLLNHGLSLDGVVLKPARVSWQNEDQLRFVLREGRKRQIRRMCELVGLKVIGLRRIRIGSVVLGKLPVGAWRYLRPDERF